MIVWKSHIGVSIAGERRIVKATAKGWGRSGALSEALLTRSGNVEGFKAVVPASNCSFFIGMSGLAGSLYDNSRAHQDDLEYSLRVSSDGTLTYQSARLAQQFSYAEHLASEVVGTVERGDAIGMRLSADRAAILVFIVEKKAAAAAAALGDASKGPLERVLKVFPEVISFPLKVMVVLGTAPSPVGPVTWLRNESKDGQSEQSALEKAVRGRKEGVDGEEGYVLEHSGPKQVKGRHAGDMLHQGTVDANGDVLVLKSAAAGSWAAGVVQRVGEPQEDLFAALPDLAKAKGKAEQQKKKKEELKKKRKAAAIAAVPTKVSKTDLAKQAAAKLQPKKVAAGERLQPGAKQAAKDAEEVEEVEASACACVGLSSKALKKLDKGERSRKGYLPSGEWVAGGAAYDEEGEVVEEGASSGMDVFGMESEKTVAMTRSIWTQVCLARHSPFLSGDEHRAIREMTEARRSRTALVTSRQLMLLLSAIEQLIPSEFMDNPPPPPLPPPGSTDANARTPFIAADIRPLPREALAHLDGGPVLFEDSPPPEGVADETPLLLKDRLIKAELPPSETPSA